MLPQKVSQTTYLFFAKGYVQVADLMVILCLKD